MKKCEDIFSSTFGGEALSLSAAIAAINFEKKVIKHLYKVGGHLKNQIINFLKEEKIEFIDLVEIQPGPFLFLKITKYKKEEIKTFFSKKLLKGEFSHSVLIILTFHIKKHINNIIRVYKEVIVLIDKYKE